MSSKTAKLFTRSAAWRISLWGTCAFACGTLGVFMVLHHFVASDIERRTDAWLSGEVQTLGDVAIRTPKGRVYGRVVREVAELASHEVPDHRNTPQGSNDSVFFMQTGSDGSPVLWVGRGDGHQALNAVRTSTYSTDTPFHLHIDGYNLPFRVVSIPLADGSRIYLGVHWPSDVLAGWSLGSVWALVAFIANRELRRRTTPHMKSGHQPSALA